MFFKAQYVGVGAVLKQYLMFGVLMGLGCYFGRWAFAVAWGGFVLILLVWFGLMSLRRAK